MINVRPLGNTSHHAGFVLATGLYPAVGLWVCVETADSNGISLTADLTGSGNVQGVLGLM